MDPGKDTGQNHPSADHKDAPGHSRRRSGHQERSKAPAAPPVPASSEPPADAGPRPLSARQRGVYHQDVIGHTADGSAIVAETGGDAPRSGAVVSPSRRPAARLKQRRHRRRGLLLPRRRRNRIRPNYARAALRLSLVLLGAACLAAVFFSPRLWVRTVRVEGLRTIGSARVMERLRLRPRTNLVLLPTRQLRAQVEQEPVVAQARIQRRFPDGVIVTIEERQPMALVRMGGVFYTVDQTMVPFRQERTPEPGLPLIDLADDASTMGTTKPPVLGKPMAAPGLLDARRCLLWAEARPDFPLAKIVVDPQGRLCLNRSGGAEVRLGTGVDLTKKLDMLALLLWRHADVRDGNVVYVNLFAHDAPAVLPRSGVGDSRNETVPGIVPSEAEPTETG